MPGSDAARRYGNRGGGWLPPAPAPAYPAGPATIGPRRGYARSTHPVELARDIRHGDRPTRTACPADTDDAEACRCTPDPAVVDELWDARARMARARAAAGHVFARGPIDDHGRHTWRRSPPLDDIDRQALRRQETPT